MLGLLPEEATQHLDEASIADDEVAARLRIVETDLVDSYVRGQLAGETLMRFESYYLSSPRRRENVRLAASFIRSIDRSAARTETVRRQNRIALPARLAWIVAAAALAIVVSGVLLFRVLPLQREFTLATSESGAVADRTREVERPAGQPTAGVEPTQEPEGDRAATGSASTASTSGSPNDSQAAPPGRIVAVVLLPPTRALAPIPTLAIPAGADRVAFELRLESNDFPRYRVGLKNPANNQILWRSDWISPKSSDDQPSLSVMVPARLLGPQHYSLDLTGRGDDGRNEVIGSYTVQIVQP